MFNIREWRKKAGLTQVELAELVNVHENTVSRWESGDREPRATDIKNLCEALDVSESDLLNGPKSKEWRIEVVFRKEDDWEMETIDMSAAAPNLFLVQVGLEKMALYLVGDPKDEAEIDSLWEKAKPKLLKVMELRRELKD